MIHAFGHLSITQGIPQYNCIIPIGYNVVKISVFKGILILIKNMDDFVLETCYHTFIIVV